MFTNSTPFNDPTPFGDPDAHTYETPDGDVVIPSSVSMDRLNRAFDRLRSSDGQDWEPYNRRTFDFNTKQLAMEGINLYGATDFPHRGCDPMLWIWSGKVVQITWDNVNFHHLRQVEETGLDSCCPMTEEGHRLYHQHVNNKLPLRGRLLRVRDFMEARARWTYENQDLLWRGLGMPPGLIDF